MPRCRIVGILNETERARASAVLNVSFKFTIKLHRSFLLRYPSSWSIDQGEENLKLRSQRAELLKDVFFSVTIGTGTCVCSSNSQRLQGFNDLSHFHQNDRMCDVSVYLQIYTFAFNQVAESTLRGGEHTGLGLDSVERALVCTL